MTRTTSRRGPEPARLLADDDLSVTLVAPFSNSVGVFNSQQLGIFWASPENATGVFFLQLPEKRFIGSSVLGLKNIKTWSIERLKYVTRNAQQVFQKAIQKTLK